MNLEKLYREQAEDVKLAAEKHGDETDAHMQRAGLLANRRERRLLEMMEGAVFWGTLKAHFALLVLSVALWFLLPMMAART